jgi:hypothetical protein
MSANIPDVWELDIDHPDWLETICISLLEVGVPPTAIGKAFQIDPQALKELQAEINVVKYGTAEISEAINFLMWRAYEDAHAVLDSAPSAQRQRFIMTLLARQSAIVGKESPQSIARMRGELEKLWADIGVEDPETESIYAPSPFTPLDGTTDDSEEGS